MSLAVALIVMVISEMVAASNGIGYFILSAQRGFKIRDMFAGVLTSAILGYILNRLFLLIENRVLAWHYGYTQQRTLNPMSRIVDLTLPVISGMAGIPKIAFYEQYPTKVHAVTVVNEEQRATLTAEGVDCWPDAPAINSMNTVFTLNTHIGTHIDAPRHFYADGPSITDSPLERIVMRQAVVLDVSHKAPGRVSPPRSSTAPACGRGRPDRGHQDVVDRPRLRQIRSSGRIRSIWIRVSANGSRRTASPPWRWIAFRKSRSGYDADPGRARRQSQALAEGRHSDDPDADRSRRYRRRIHDDRAASAAARHGWLAGAGHRHRKPLTTSMLMTFHEVHGETGRCFYDDARDMRRPEMPRKQERTILGALLQQAHPRCSRHFRQFAEFGIPVRGINLSA